MMFIIMQALVLNKLAETKWRGQYKMAHVLNALSQLMHTVVTQCSELATATCVL